MKKDHKYMDLFLLAVTIIWGIKPTAMKIGLRYIPVSDYTVFSWSLTKKYSANQITAYAMKASFMKALVSIIDINESWHIGI